MEYSLLTAKKNCESCKWSDSHIGFWPQGLDESGNIIYEQRNFVCGLEPVTEDGKFCPNFKNK